jgi:suppressor of ftsI/bilirubin oxidase
VSEAFLSPGERLDILLDLSGLNDGQVVFLKSVPFDPMDQEAMGSSQIGMAMRGRMRSRRAAPQPAMSMVPNGAELYLLALDVSGPRRYRHVPPQLSRVDPIDTRGAVVRALPLTMEMVETPEGMMMAWTIDGDRFDPSAFPLEVKRNKVEIWEIRNDMMSMPHPMHIHGYQFQVLERRGSPAQAWGSGRRHLLATDGGWKDTVLTWPGETVQIAIDFSTPFTGPQEYVFHCHNLEHEDQGMMINYRVI